MRIFAAMLVLAGVAGCQSAAEQMPDPILQPMRVPTTITMAAHVAADSTGVLTGWLDFTNTSTSAATVDHGACALAVQLMRPGEETVRWQSVAPGNQVCIMILRQVHVAAGSTVSDPAGKLVASGAVPAPPPGEYDARVLLNIEGQVRRVPAGSVRIP